MDKIPAYLAWYLLKIRSLPDKADNLKERFERMPEKRMLLEMGMIDEMLMLHLIFATDYTMRKVFLPDGTTLMVKEPVDELAYPAGTRTVPFRTSVTIAPRGHYFIRESVIQFIGRTVWTAIVALLGIVIGLSIGS